MGFFGKRSKKEPALNVAPPSQTRQVDNQAKPQSETPFSTTQEEASQVCRYTEIADKFAAWGVPHEFPKTIDITAGSIYHLGYSYSDVNVAGANYFDIDYADLKPKRVELVPQPDNEFDEKAIAIRSDGTDLGFVPKGKLQEMTIDYLSDDGRYVMAWLVEVDESSKKLAVAMGFYKIERLKPILEFTCKLTKTSKKDYLGEKRSDNLECTIDGEELSISQETNFETFDESYVVMSTAGEIGELPKSAVSKLENIEYDIESATAILEDSDTGVIRLLAY